MYKIGLQQASVLVKNREVEKWNTVYQKILENEGRDWRRTDRKYKSLAFYYIHCGLSYELLILMEFCMSKK